MSREEYTKFEQFLKEREKRAAKRRAKRQKLVEQRQAEWEAAHKTEANYG